MAIREHHSMRISGSARSTRAVLAILAAIWLAACGGAASTTSSQTPPATTTTTVTRTATESAPSVTQSSPTATQSATTTSASTGQTPTSPVSALCRAAGLTVSFLGQQGATGHGELGFALRNTATASCHTFGYPGVQFLDRSGVSLPTSATRTTSDIFGHSPLGRLVVGRGRTVSFRLVVTHGIGSTAGCRTAYGLQVIAPDDTATRRVSIPGGATECGTATVSPLRAGTSAYP